MAAVDVSVEVSAASEPEPEPEPEPAALPTAATAVRLRTYALAAAGAAAAPDGELAVQLVHMAAPEDGKWSRAKKQCDLWEYVWGASQMLADTLLTTAAHRRAAGTGGLAGVRALELGAGAGLCSLVAGLSGASVLATDGVADAVQLWYLSGTFLCIFDGENAEFTPALG